MTTFFIKNLFILSFCSLLLSLSSAAYPSCENDSVTVALNSLKLKDVNSFEHSFRVAKLSEDIANKMNLNKETIHSAKISALLHDIGKIGIPDAILKKTSSLTKEEYEKIKKHPLMSELIITKVKCLEKYKKYIRNHHERYDGKGYPDGLLGDNIPLISRIITVADSFDAMTSDRPYKKKMTNEEAVAELIKNTKTQFDPKVVDVFVKIKH